MFRSKDPKPSVFDEVMHNRVALENFKRATQGKMPLDKPLGPKLFSGPSLSLNPMANPLESLSESPGSPGLLEGSAMRLSDIQGNGFDSPFSSVPVAKPANLFDGKFGSTSPSLLTEPLKPPAPQQPNFPPPTPTFVFPKRPFQ